MGNKECITEARAGDAHHRLVGMRGAHARSCRCDGASNCAKRSHPPSSARLAVRCGIGAVVFTCAFMGVIHLGSLSVPTVRHLLAQCESVNVYGNCQSGSSASEGADPCVLINAEGACENQYQVEHPAHTMVK